MIVTAEELLDAALTLSVGDRVELVAALIASLLPADRPPFDESWREVVLRRSAELEAGQVQSIPWAEVERQGRERAVANVRFHPEFPKASSIGRTRITS